MLLNKILEEMGEEGILTGDMSFEKLSLVVADFEERRLTFVDDPKYADSVPKNSLVMTTSEIAPLLGAKDICICEKPRIIFFRIHNFLSGKDDYKRRHFITQIGNDCIISPLAKIAENNIIIGNNAIIEEFVSIKENTVIGNNCIIRAGSVIGGEGTQFMRDGEKILFVIHAGGVIIGNDVQIQHNSCIDCAVYPWDNTLIGDSVKVGSCVLIGHAVRIDANVMIMSCSCIAGRVHVMKNSWIGPSVTIVNGITLGENSRVNIGSVAMKDVEEGGSITGNFYWKARQ